MKTHETPLEQLAQGLHTDLKTGLPQAQAESLLKDVGPNQLQGKKKKSMLQRFFEQFKDAMIIILLIAAAISFVLALQGHDAKEFFEPALILLIVVLNAIMGVMQESKAEKALDALKSMSAPHARVRRDGKEQIIDAAQLVPGDVILVEAGDFVPADARLIESANLKAEESALTGESVPVEKHARAVVAEGAPIGDRLNMLYSGCSITYGRGSALVTETGMNTEMGKIAMLLSQEDDNQTPLQQKLAKLGRMLGIMAIVICAVIFVMGLIWQMPILEIFMTAVSLAVSAIPEGLPAIVTIVLSIGVTRMAKRNAIIRNLPAVETLGSASVICSDKTGTLTQNRMTLVKAFDAQNDHMEQISGSNSEDIRELLKYATLCSDGSIAVDEKGTVQHLGDPTETCIVLAAQDNGMTKKALNEAYPREAELPFDSDRKLMTVVCKMNDRHVVITKGAFDSFVGRVTSGDMERAKSLVDQLGSEALRVLAVGYKWIDQVPEDPKFDELESDLTLMGLVCMIDPPRPEVRVAVEECRRAGIRPVMITGDHVVTASAIAKDLGIQQPGDASITGAELAKISDDELDKAVKTTAVYARVSPEDKIRIVKAWQRQGAVVSMTGDGVNDAPALKAADIGCAMGITGTDVSKGAADMILTDDNFATIVAAVKEGRGIYDNIKKAVAFLLSTNIGEVITVFVAMLLWHQTPLLSMQLLWINLITDSFPAIALGMEQVEAEVMDRGPKPKDEGLFAHGLGIRIALQGVLFAVLTLVGFQLGQHFTGHIDGARTMAFMVLSLCQLVHAFNMRSDHSLKDIGIFTNKNLNLAVLGSLALMVVVLFVPPVAMVFGLTLLPWYLYAIGLGLSLVPLIVIELLKAVKIIRVKQ
ncbi:calcium-translocating P-type ATPase, PMCA-type [Eubacteriales bacterium OttesenSCG-928-N13]|nr:calcium-translocating P-type ATPase, PMCA-type [Eubacteriales bacterium OttesenSCG-928-N13]